MESGMSEILDWNADRDRIYAEQARRYPGFAEYARQTATERDAWSGWRRIRDSNS
jgi:hypothetical protein